jgi:hypothetical protein
MTEHRQPLAVFEARQKIWPSELRIETAGVCFRTGSFASTGTPSLLNAAWTVCIEFGRSFVDTELCAT